jgi:hypothetical protein
MRVPFSGDPDMAATLETPSAVTMYARDLPAASLPSEKPGGCAPPAGARESEEFRQAESAGSFVCRRAAVGRITGDKIAGATG